ncbi:glycosyltransferase family 2 protein, partial [Peptacetobacter sp.]|uniref:glycosyltransferase family 2 protein n=1 Tax=Peptacetobacter sp. TaxID=2991975 RepID=UPI0026364B91
MKKIDIVIPCYNESEVLDIFYNAMNEILINMNYEFKFIFIDDGSKDTTLNILKNLTKKDRRVKYISFSRNFGKESAMYAGLKNSTGDMVLIIDSDMQNPPSLIPKMIQALEEGYDCCAGYRADRKGDGKIRNIFTNSFYKITNKISEVNMPNGAGDFRLMSRKMVDAILNLSEVQRFSKGIFSWVGFKTKWISFENVKRAGGQSKWNFFKLFSYAIDGITAFSTFPLKIASFLGTTISLISFIYLIYIILKTIIFGKDIPGYASIIALILFIGGIIILALGILGEYIGKIYLEVKNRP